jgi:ABC-2 type transport system ATP-binding protein
MVAPSYFRADKHMTAAIELQGLSKTYRKSAFSAPMQALKDLSLTVAAGETFGFIGANGAGKSTTIKILVGAMRSSSGRASLFGVDVQDPRSRRGLGYVPENPNPGGFLTPLELLRMGMSLSGGGPDNPEKHAMHWLERLGLAAEANKLIRTFSKGMVQRSVLAHALSLRPRLLILDEPLSGLDPVGRKEVVDILAEYRKNGGTIFLTSHVLHDVERLADRFGLIHQGELLTLRAPGELLPNQSVVIVRSLGKQAPPGFEAEPGSRWVASVPSDQLWRVLQQLRELHHALIEVKPTLSLEQVFIQAIGHH